MLTHTLTLLLALFSFFTLAYPEYVLSRDSDAKTERWYIPSMQMHYMTDYTGLVGGGWPPDRIFNSTLDFLVCSTSSLHRTAISGS